MKIAINCIFYQPKGGGIAEYIYNLVNNIEELDHSNEYVLYVLNDQLDFARKNLPSRFKLKVLPYGTSYVDVIKRSLFAQTFWTKEEKIERFDVFHSPFFHSPKFKNAKVIITVHDMRFYRFPYTYTLPRYVFLKYKVRRSVKAADRIITISQFTKDELMDAYHLPDNKITVIHEAINRDRFSKNKIQDFTLPENLEFLEKGYILSVGHIEPRKNYDRLINAFVKLKTGDKFSDLKLVIVGKKGHHYKNTLNLISETPDVIYLNFVSHELLVWLYNHASLFVFPSYYEGFGFPPLEAGCSNVVSAVSNVSSMPEICGDAVAYFNPYDTNEMANVMKTCLDDTKLRNYLMERMKLQLDKYSWKINASRTIELYNSMM